MRQACWFSRRWDAAQQAGNAIAIHFVSLLFKWASEDFVRSEAGSGSQGHGLLCDSSALNWLWMQNCRAARVIWSVMDIVSR
jgi:hypothetical protein